MLEKTPDAVDAAYRERAQLVALLASLYPSHIGHNDLAEPDWAVVIIEAPTGQLSWHVSPTDLPLFSHVQRTTRICRSWDGHTTEEKYERVRDLIREIEGGCQPRVPFVAAIPSGAEETSEVREQLPDVDQAAERITAYIEARALAAQYRGTSRPDGIARLAAPFGHQLNETDLIAVLRSWAVARARVPDLEGEREQARRVARHLRSGSADTASVDHGVRWHLGLPRDGSEDGPIHWLIGKPQPAVAPDSTEGTAS